MGTVLVEVDSDVVCPWCYIGKRRLDTALAQLAAGGGAGDLEVVFRPFQLDPTAPPTPTPALDAYARKFGGPERAARLVEQVSAVAASVGLEFRLDRALRANTLDAHRLLGWALATAGPAAQAALKEALMRAYFTEGLDVGDRATLAGLAGNCGLDAAVASEFLDGDGGLDEVREQLARAAAAGISAVPTTVLDGRWAVPGAQEPETFVQVFRRWRARRDEVLAGTPPDDHAP